MEDHPEVSAALVDVRLVIAEGTEPVSGLAVAQFQRAKSVIQLMGGTDSGQNQAKRLYLTALETEGAVADLSKDALAAKAHAGLCSLCQALGEFDEALSHAQKAVDIDQVLVLLSADSKYQLAMSLNALGTCHAHVGEQEAATTVYRDAVAQYREVVLSLTPPAEGQEDQGEQEGLAMALNNLGMLLAQQKQYEEAAVCFEESVANRDPAREATHRTLRHLAQVCELAGDMPGAASAEARLAAIEAVL